LRPLAWSVAVAALVAAIVLLVSPAPAQDILGHGRGTRVIVWASQAALERARNSETMGWLARNEPIPSEVAPLIACVVASGTRARIDRLPGSYLFTATVVEGEFSGCQGIVGPRDFSTASELAAGERQKIATERAQKAAACKARFDTWFAAQPRGTKASKADVDRAVRQGCTDLILEQATQELDAQRRAAEAAKWEKRARESEWSKGVQGCIASGQSEDEKFDAYVSGPGKVQMVGTARARHAFTKCMTEAGHQLR